MILNKLQFRLKRFYIRDRKLVEKKRRIVMNNFRGIYTLIAFGILLTNLSASILIIIKHVNGAL